MKLLNKLLVLTLISNLFILVGAGEGITIFAQTEVLAPIQFVGGYVKFSLDNGDIDSKFFSLALIALCGQITFLVALFVKKCMFKIIMIYAGSIISIFSIIFLLIQASDFNDFYFWSSVPFLLSCFSLLIITSMKYRQFTTVKQEFSI